MEEEKKKGDMKKGGGGGGGGGNCTVKLEGSLVFACRGVSHVCILDCCLLTSAN